MHSTIRSAVTLIVILLLFLAFNLVWIGRIPNIRWDFSLQQIHTLSPAARHLVTTLEDPVDLYYFNAQPHGKRTNDEKRYGLRVEDLLKEYEKAASGRINLHIIHPAPYSEDAYKAALFGLDERHGFFGLIGTRAGHSAQRIDAFSSDNEALLEYEIGDLLHKLSNPERRSIGLLSGSPIDRSSKRLLAQLTRHFNLTELAPRLERVPLTLKTLMVAHPENLPEQTLYAIDQFVLGGGKLLMFTNPMGNTPPNAMASKVSSMLAGWGVQMQIGEAVPDKTLAHPTRLTLSRKMTNVNDISSENINTLTVSSSGALSRAEKSRILFTPLLQSSAYSTGVTVGVGAPNEDTIAQVQRAVVAARIEGPAYSAFVGGVERQATGLQKASQIHAVVVADVDMLSDALNNPSRNDNTQFVLNILDNLAAPAVLADIRPRTMVGHSLHVLEAMRAVAAQAYRDKASELERRLERTEREWQMMHPQAMLLDPQPVDTSIQLQALNKERLRLPMELHSLKIAAYAQVQHLTFIIKLTLIAAVPLVLCLIAWVLFLYQNRRRALPPAAFD